MNAVDFYRERDRRTRECNVAETICREEIFLAIGRDAAETARGQIMMLSLVNMLARMHRCIRVLSPDVPLYPCAMTSRLSLDRGRSFLEAVFAIARKADPFIELREGVPETLKAGIGIGRPDFSHLPYYLGCHRDFASLATNPLPADSGEGFSLGTGLAACIGAAAILKQVTGQPVLPASVSAWTVNDAQAAVGPEVLPKLDVGNVIMVGAGGVGSCLAYWGCFVPLGGHWTVIDGDIAELHNTNRSLGLFPEHTGWDGKLPAKKAQVAAGLLNCAFADKWYDEVDLSDQQLDLVLPLANDRGVRAAISQRGDPIILYATTASHGEAQLHRHIPDRDDCIVCRMPQKDAPAEFRCSEAKVKVAETSTDAALPFLSAAAGLMLLAGLYRLALGDLGRSHHNIWRANFLSPRRLMLPGQYPSCGPCLYVPSRAIRRRLHAESKWFPLDEEAMRA